MEPVEEGKGVAAPAEPVAVRRFDAHAWIGAYTEAAGEPPSLKLLVGPVIYAIEKYRQGRWHFLVAFGGDLGEAEARVWLAKPHQPKGRYRCRLLIAGEDVTARLQKPLKHVAEDTEL